MHWQKIDSAQIQVGTGFFQENIEVLLSRAQVPGGWLVLAATPSGTSRPVSITFYPDPSHSWDGGLPPDA